MQIDRLGFTISTQQSVLKNMHRVLRYLPKCVKFCWFGLGGGFSILFLVISWELVHIFQNRFLYWRGARGRASRCPRGLKKCWYLPHGYGLGKQCQLIKIAHFVFFWTTQLGVGIDILKTDFQGLGRVGNEKGMVESVVILLAYLYSDYQMCDFLNTNTW